MKLLLPFIQATRHSSQVASCVLFKGGHQKREEHVARHFEEQTNTQQQINGTAYALARPSCLQYCHGVAAAAAVVDAGTETVVGE